MDDATLQALRAHPVTLRGIVHYLCSHDQQHLADLQWLLGKIESKER